MPDTWSEYTVFEAPSPIVHAVYEVDAPAARPLAHRALKAPVGGTVAYAAAPIEGGTRHRWEIRDVPRVFEEPNMPEFYTCVQRLLLSTIPDWKTVSRWYWNLSKPRLEAVTPEMRAKVDELVAGQADRRAKIETLFRFVSQQIRYMGITTEKEAPGYEPHDVSLTFQNRYGVCRDKAALLAAMLRLAGIDGFPTLIHAGPKKDAEVPQPYFNHAIVAAREPDGSYLLMDPTDESTRQLLPAYLNDCSYLVATPEGETLLTSPIVPAVENLVRIATEATLDAAGGLDAASTLRFEGINDNAYRGHFANLKPEQRRQFFEGVVKRVAPGARLVEFDLQPADMQNTAVPLTARLRFRSDEAWVRNDREALLSAPWFGGAVGMVNFILGQTGLEKRRFPLKTEIACGVEETLALDLSAAGARAAAAPSYEAVDQPTVVWTRRLAAADGAMRGDARFLLKAAEFSPEEYLGLKAALRTIDFNDRKRVALALPETPVPPGAAEADAIVLDARASYWLADARTAFITNEVRRKILTYAGVKANSEIKVSYNPAWEDVQLDAARVIARDGSIKTVSAAEINRMDAAWVGSAPRYPAEKNMVVSLPGVEQGAVIEARIVRAERDRPFVSVVESFGGHDPILEKTVEISYPSDLRPRELDRTRGLARREAAEAGGRTTVRWTARRLPVVKREDAPPPAWVVLPTVFFSTGDWRTFAADLSGVLSRAARPGETARARARELTAGRSDDAARIVAIRDYVARGIRPAGPGLDALPWSAIAPAETTLDEGYGNSADRAVALHALLAAAGFRPSFVLASGEPPAPAVWQPAVECPQRGLFDYALVRVRAGRETWYLNDTDQYARPGTTGHEDGPALDLSGRSVGRVEPAPGARTRAETRCEVRLEADGAAEIEIARRYYGEAHAGFRRRCAELSPEETRRHHQEEVAAVSQAAALKGEWVRKPDEYPGTESFTVRVARFAVRDGDALYFELPQAPRNVLGLRTDSRETPLLLGDAQRRRSEFVVRPPPGFAAVGIAPPDIEWVAPDGRGRIVFSTERAADGSALTIVRDMDLDAAVVPAAMYPELLDLNRRLSHPSSWTVLLRGGPPAAD
jgi:transglutaminase-like putative cysteine protease